MHIHHKLIIIAGSISVLPLLFVNVFFYVNARHTMENQIYNQLELTRTFEADRLKTFFATCRNDLLISQNRVTIRTVLPVLDRFVHDNANPACRKARKTINSQLRLLQNTNPCADIILLNKSGLGIYASNQAHEKYHLNKHLNDLDLPHSGNQWMKIYCPVCR